MRRAAPFVVLLGVPLVILMLFAAARNARRSAAPGDLGFTDTPMLPGLPYHVHDPNRPHPPVVTPGTQPGAAPSDAVVLFDGRDLSHWRAVTLNTTGYTAHPEPPDWKVEGGSMEPVHGGRDIATREKFGDVQLHVEWYEPTGARGSSQSRGNSGVFLQGLYEVQVLDSYQNPTYADGQAGAIYGQWPPLVNAVRPPGEWQTYDIFFEAPRFDGAKLSEPACLTVVLNGVLVQNHRRAMGPTVYRQAAHYVPQPAEDSVVLQNHGSEVHFRNIWARNLTTAPPQP
jgi:hypothetical protein